MRIAADAESAEPLIVGDAESWLVADLLPSLVEGHRLTLSDLLAGWNDIGPRLRRAGTTPQGSSTTGVQRWGPPASRATKIICAIDNYRDHADEFSTAVFPKPIFFLKPSSALIGHRGTVQLPKSAARVDYELELAAVIGKRCRAIRPSQAATAILGYTILLDMSARDFRSIPYTWFAMKAWDTFAPLGPYIVTSDEVGDPQQLNMMLSVNGRQLMIGHTSDMIFSVADLVSAASEVTTLVPGDIVSTGTVAGVCPAEDGDEVEATIERIGTLRVSVRRSETQTFWHDQTFPRHYATFRDDPASDSGSDPVAPSAGA